MSLKKASQAPAAPRPDEFASEMMESGEGILNLKDLVTRILARWPWILLCLLLGMGIASFIIWRSSPLFQSITTVLVRDSNVDAFGKNDSSDFDVQNDEALETIRSSLMTLEMCEAIASEPHIRKLRHLMPMGPKPLPFMGDPEREQRGIEVPPPAELAEMIQDWLSVEVRRNTRLIDITITHEDPKVSQALANEFVSQYSKQRTEKKASVSQDNLQYLLGESGRVKKDLQEAQNVLASYTAPLEFEKALTVAEANQSTLALRYGPMHPTMREANNQLESARTQLRSSLLRAMDNPVDADYWSDFRESEEELASVENLNRVRDLFIARHTVLESEIESQNSLYSTILAQMETTGLSTDTNASEVARQSSAREGVQIAPRKSLILAGGVMGGFALGLALAFLLQLLDNKFHSPMDIETHFDYPVLAAITKIPELVKGEGASAKSSSSRRSHVGGSRAKDLLFAHSETKANYLEMFRVLRTSVALLGPQEDRKVTMVTSATPAEGKSFVAANLAAALAQQGLKTLLIDFDLRKPSLHRLFAMKRDGQPGLVEHLVGAASLSDAVHGHPSFPNLHLALSGSQAPNPGELLELQRVKSLLDELRQHFDHIVVDTAPILPVPDSRLLAPLADNLILVVRAEQTPRRLVESVLSIFDKAGVSPEGIVLNGYEEKKGFGKKYSYGYDGYGGYGYGSSYGDVYGEGSSSD